MSDFDSVWGEVSSFLRASMPSDLVIKERCKCGKGDVWGKQTRDGVVYLKSQYGHEIKHCSDCNEKLLENNLEKDKRKALDGLRRYEDECRENGVPIGTPRALMKGRKRVTTTGQSF